DPDEGPRVLVDEADAVGDLQTGRAEQGARLVRLRRGEEDRVTRLSAGGRGQAGALLLADVLGDRAAEGAVLADRDVGQPAGAALLGPLLPRVELATGLARTTGHDDSADVRGLEHPERGAGGVLGGGGELELGLQVRLVGAVPGHRLGVTDPWDRGADLVPDEAPPLDQHLLGDGDDVLLVDEAHLDVELGELRLTVGPEVLVAVAAGDLV